MLFAEVTIYFVLSAICIVILIIKCFCVQLQAFGRLYASAIESGIVVTVDCALEAGQSSFCMVSVNTIRPV